MGFRVFRGLQYLGLKGFRVLGFEGLGYFLVVE